MLRFFQIQNHCLMKLMADLLQPYQFLQNNQEHFLQFISESYSSVS